MISILHNIYVFQINFKLLYFFIGHFRADNVDYFCWCGNSYGCDFYI